MDSLFSGYGEGIRVGEHGRGREKKREIERQREKRREKEREKETESCAFRIVGRERKRE